VLAAHQLTGRPLAGPSLQNVLTGHSACWVQGFTQAGPDPEPSSMQVIPGTHAGDRPHFADGADEQARADAREKERTRAPTRPRAEVGRGAAGDATLTIRVFNFAPGWGGVACTYSTGVRLTRRVRTIRFCLVFCTPDAFAPEARRFLMTIYRTARLAALSFSGIVGCGGGANGNGPSAASSGPPAVVADGGAMPTAAAATNPDGVPYPTPPNGYGTSPRSGSTPGSIMQNFKFLGYRNGDASKGLQTISMADYYDPCGTQYALIHLAVAAVWCEPCNEETAAMVQAEAQLTAQRIVVLQALDEGPAVGTGATQSDLDGWIRKYSPTFTEMLDPELQTLGGFLSTSGVPWNCDIDPRTMEIIDDGTGWTGDVPTELQPALSGLQVDANGKVGSPPSYPIPAAAACN
jgi:hypothetical protein